TAERARLRSGYAAAAAALERAAELSTDPASAARRLVGAADAAWHAGQPERANALLDQASPIVAQPEIRAALDHLRGAIEWRSGSLLEASAILMAGAARAAPSDPRKALAMLLDAGMTAATGGDYESVALAGQRAAALPRLDAQSEFEVDLLTAVG